MNSTSAMLMVIICILGIISLLVMIAVYHLPPQLQPFVAWFKHKFQRSSPHKNSERLISQYLQHQQVQHIVYVHDGEILSLFHFLNQSEVEFSRADLNRVPLRHSLEHALDAASTHRHTPNLSMASVNQIPQGHSQLLCLALAGFSIAKASLTLIGSDDFIRGINPKIIKKVTTPTFIQSPNNQLLPLLKGANPFPWAMVNNAIDYWSVNPTLVNQYALQSELKLDRSLLKDAILIGYKVGIQDNLIKHYVGLSA